MVYFVPKNIVDVVSNRQRQYQFEYWFYLYVIYDLKIEYRKLKAIFNVKKNCSGKLLPLFNTQFQVVYYIEPIFKFRYDIIHIYNHVVSICIGEFLQYKWKFPQNSNIQVVKSYSNYNIMVVFVVLFQSIWKWFYTTKPLIIY